MCHYYSAFSVFSENMGHPQPIKIVIIKCPKLPRIYGKPILPVSGLLGVGEAQDMSELEHMQEIQHPQGLLSWGTLKKEFLKNISV